MKVIELLNKIANEEEVPKKIQVYSDIFVLNCSNMVYESERTRTNLLSIYNGNILNYEVEIKEDKPFNKRVEEIYNRHIDYIYDKEDKKIEEINEIEYYHQYDECWAKDKFYKDQKGNLVDEIIIDKVNEIIKVINEMREDK